MSKVRIRDEWDNPDLGEMIAKARRDDPAYDKIWCDFLQKMADDIDARIAEQVYREVFQQRTGDDPI